MTFSLAQIRSEPAPTETTILVVAAHALVRAGLRSVLGDQTGLSVVGEAQNIEDARAVGGDIRPDVVLLNEPPTSDIEHEGIAVLRRALPTACVLCLGSSESLSGDVLCIPAEAGVSELCSVLGAALDGRCAGCLLRPTCAVPRIAVALSRRETQVAACVADGMSSKQIAASLGIALRTVNTYRESLARKLGASSAAVITRYVIECGLRSHR